MVQVLLLYVTFMYEAVQSYTLYDWTASVLKMYGEM